MKMIKKASLIAAVVAASASASAYTNLKDGKFDVHLWSKPFIECLQKPGFNLGDAKQGDEFTSNFKLRGNPTQTYIIKMNGGMFAVGGNQRRLKGQDANNNTSFLNYAISKPDNTPWGNNDGFGTVHSFTMPANGTVDVPVKVTMTGDPETVPAGHYADWVSFWIGY